MKKIAILIAGEYREFETAFKSWTFQEHFDVDYYIATWGTSYQHNERLKIQIKESIKKENILKIIPNCKGIDIVSNLQHYLLKLNSSNSRLMINRWFSVIQLMNKDNAVYDAVILTRPDLCIKYNYTSIENLISQLQDNTIYLPSFDKTTSRFFVQDQLLFGSQKAIEKLLLLPDEKIIDIHSWLSLRLSQLYENIERLEIEMGIVRPNCRGLEHLDVDTVNRHAEVWFRTKNDNLDVIIKEFSGFSGSKVFLIKNFNDFFIRKINNVERNYQKMTILKEAGFLVPNVIYKHDDTLNMEYISGIDIKTFLRTNDTRILTDFIITSIKRFKDMGSVEKDYTDIYYEQLSWLKDDNALPFNVEQLVMRLPKILPSSLCHGDFTLENIIYKDPVFYMIDPSTGSYDSWVFDLAKLRQDLDARWFVRNKTDHGLEIELNFIKEALKTEFPEAFDDYLYILMLLRVYKYSQHDSDEHAFLLKEIKRLWK